MVQKKTPMACKIRKWNDSAVDVAEIDSLDPHSREVEEGIAEGRGQKGHLQIDGQHGCEPEHVKPEGLGHRQKDGEGDHDDADPVDETSENDVDDLHQGIGPPFAQSRVR